MELIIINDGLYQLLPVTKEIMKDIIIYMSIVYYGLLLLWVKTY